MKTDEEIALLVVDLVKKRHDNPNDDHMAQIWAGVEGGDDWMNDLLAVADVAIAFLEKHLRQTVPGLRAYLDQLESDVRFTALTLPLTSREELTAPPTTPPGQAGQTQGETP